MKSKYLEISCDKCCHGEHYPSTYSDFGLRREGWIITKNGKHYCSRGCYKAVAEDRRKSALKFTDRGLS